MTWVNPLCIISSIAYLIAMTSPSKVLSLVRMRLVPAGINRPR
jgi:hypothetical protein